MSYSVNSSILEKYLSQSISHLSCHVKKNKYFVKDGWVIYQVNITPIIKCQCASENRLCNHVLYVLDKVFHINFDVLKFFHKLNIHIANTIRQKKLNINDEIIGIINKNIINDNCGICLEPMNIESLFKQCLYECPKCLKHAHLKCIHKWKITNMAVTNECIYCRG
jgi:hypothetical protein